jgi:predicted secreted protein with PEFG-CTERM motif
VNASEQAGPKVILVNLGNTTINVSELRYIGVMFDGQPIAPSPDVNAILHPKSTDNPSFAIIVTSGGAQILVLIPHFSTHTITITNLPKTTSPIPEFPATTLALTIALISIVALAKNSMSKLNN